MKYAIIDTETSGLFDFAQPADAAGQPRLAALAIIVIEPPSETAIEHTFLIRPDGWAMSPEVTAINGLTTEYLAAHGIPVADAISVYASLIDGGCIVAAFNAQFDTKIMRGEMRRAGIPDRFESTPNICLMRGLTQHCRVPKKTGNGYKFPKLSEACAYFKLEQPAAHSAMGDARSAFALFREMHKLGILPFPEVHHSTVPPAAKAVTP